MICTTYFLTFFSELIPPTGTGFIINYLKVYYKPKIAFIKNVFFECKNKEMHFHTIKGYK